MLVSTHKDLVKNPNIQISKFFIKSRVSNHTCVLSNVAICWVNDIFSINAFTKSICSKRHILKIFLNRGNVLHICMDVNVIIFGLMVDV